MWDVLLPILVTTLTTILSYIGLRLRSLYEQYINTKEKEAVVRNTVRYIEQVFGALKGAEKLETAKITALDWLHEKGIEISDAELTILIESSVKALKGSFYVEENKEEI